MSARPGRRPRAAIYCRQAATGQDAAGLDAQEAACRRYAARHHYRVDRAHVYRELADGLRVTDRPQFSALCEAVKRGEVDVVIAERPDRLARDAEIFGALAAEWEHAHVALAFVAGVSGQKGA